MIKYLAVLTAVLTALAYGALKYHFIRTDDGFEVLKKIDITLEDTYVDARGAKSFKLLLKPALIKAGLKEALENKDK